MWYLKQIPKIVHFYWGGGKLSFLRYMSVKSFASHNPDWQIQFHVPQVTSTTAPTWASFEQQEIEVEYDWQAHLSELGVEIVGHDFELYGFDNQAHEVHKSDFLRWRVLHTVGGVWSDIDILYVKPMDDLVENTKKNSKLDTALCPLIPPRKHTVGFMMGSPGNEFYQHISNLCLAQYDKNRYQCIGSELINNKYETLESFHNSFPRNHFAFLNKNCVYSIPVKEIDDFYKEINHITVKRMKHPVIIGYHWFAGHPTSREFESLLTPETLDTHNNLLTTVIKNKEYYP
jgi:hypothetical protein